MKRVKQIIIDILTDENEDGVKLSEKIAETLENNGYIILGSDFADDLTEAYGKYCPDLLNEFM